MRVLSLFSRCVLGVKWLFTEVNNVALAANGKAEPGKPAAAAPKAIHGRAERFTCTSHAAKSLFTVYNAERK